jgi:hypothetical protein
MGLFVLTAALSWTSLSCPAQQNSIPNAVTTRFVGMFPDAKNIDWRQKSQNIQVFFLTNNDQCEAKFQPDGHWLSTERRISLDSLPARAREVIGSGDYAGWNILKAFIVQFPVDPLQYRVVIANKDGLRKILSYSQDGQLIKSNLAL